MRHLAPLFLLAGCSAPTGSGPSLLPRPIETRSDVEPERQPIIAAPDPALDARIAEAATTLDTALTTYAAAIAGLAPRIARGRRAAEGSEAWLDAQAALGELGQARASADAALADLETLAIDRALAAQPPYPALDARIAKAQSDLGALAARVDEGAGTTR